MELIQHLQNITFELQSLDSSLNILFTITFICLSGATNSLSVSAILVDCNSHFLGANGLREDGVVSEVWLCDEISSEFKLHWVLISALPGFEVIYERYFCCANQKPWKTAEITQQFSTQQLQRVHTTMWYISFFVQVVQNRSL